MMDFSGSQGHRTPTLDSRLQAGFALEGTRPIQDWIGSERLLPAPPSLWAVWSRAAFPADPRAWTGAASACGRISIRSRSMTRVLPGTASGVVVPMTIRLTAPGLLCSNEKYSNVRHSTTVWALTTWGPGQPAL